MKRCTAALTFGGQVAQCRHSERHSGTHYADTADGGNVTWSYTTNFQVSDDAA